MTRRVLVGSLALAIFVILVLELPLGAFFAARERERFAEGVASDAAVIGSHYEDALEGLDTARRQFVVDYARRTGARAVVVTTRGTSVADSETPRRRDFSTRPEIRGALDGRLTQGTRRSETLGTRILYVAQPIASGGEVHGAVRVTVPTTDVDRRVRRFWLTLVLIDVILLTVTAFVAWRLARSVTRPLRELETTAEAFGRGDLAPRDAPTGAPPELVGLSDTLNAMARDLRRMLTAQRSFVADASHQLRTPLTALQLRLENLQAKAGPDQADELASIQGEITRMTDLVEQLLSLARADRTIDPRPVDLGAVAAERIDTWGAVASDRDVRLRLDAPAGPLVVAGGGGALDQVLDNLLDNAIDAAPAGSEVSVRLRPDAGGGGSLAVVDHGRGMSDEEKLHARERFWRGSRPTTAGTGLGLAIVDALVAGLHGTVALSDTPGGGLTVTVGLPPTPPAGTPPDR